MTTNARTMSAFSAYATKGLLLASGMLAAGIAVTIFFAPDAFYASYEIDIGTNVGLINELKAPAGMLLMAGLLMLAGVFKAEFVVPSLATATVIYLSYGLSRVLSMMIDGVPNSALVGAAVLEIAIGVSCFLGLMHIRRAGRMQGQANIGGTSNLVRGSADVAK